MRDAEIDEQRLEEVLRITALKELVENDLPKGLDTILERMGCVYPAARGNAWVSRAHFILIGRCSFWTRQQAHSTWKRSEKS